MGHALATAATAFEQTLHDLGFSGDEAELGDAVELGTRGALLAVSDLVWKRHLGPLLDCKQVQMMLGGRTRQAVSDLAKRKRLLALPDAKGRLRFSSFQFTSTGRPLPGLADILELLAAADVNPYTMASWFVTPQPALNGESPVDWLRSGRDVSVVVEAARRSASRLGQ